MEGLKEHNLEKLLVPMLLPRHKCSMLVVQLIQQFLALLRKKTRSNPYGFRKVCSCKLDQDMAEVHARHLLTER